MAKQWTDTEHAMAKADCVYWRYICNSAGYREICRNLDEVKSGHGVLVFDHEKFADIQKGK